MTLDEGAQRRRLRAFVARAVGVEPDDVVPSPRALGYRARVRLRVSPAGWLGYHQPRSHNLVPIPACAIARPEINEVLAGLPPLPPGLESVELRSDGEAVLISGWRARGAPRDVGAQVRALGLEALPGVRGVAVDGRPVAGDAAGRLLVGGVEHRPGPGVFYQVNLEVNAALVAAVGDHVMACSPSAVLDLYAGIGNLSLPLAARGVPCVLVESDADAAGEARRTASRIPGVRVEVRPTAAQRFRPGDAFFDVAVLDPPRAGAADALPAVLATRPRRIVYVSCNPIALGRDLRLARAAGYTTSNVTLFDMFPQTPHVEVLAVLDRGP